MTINPKARFERKENAIDVQPFRVVALETINEIQWQRFSQNLLDDYDIIAGHAKDLHVGSDGVTNALLVLNEETGEGILVNSEGFSYARYSAYLPFAKLYLDSEIARVADYCVTKGLENASDGMRVLDFEGIRARFGIDVSNDERLKEILANSLQTREEVARVGMTEDGFAIKYSLDFCPPIPVLRDEYDDVYQDEVDVAAAKHLLWVHDIPGGEQADFSGKRFLHVDFSGCKLNNAVFRDSLFESCKFNIADLCFADFTGAVFRDCQMTYIAADELNMKGAFLKNCDLSYLIACHCNFADATFSQCSFFNGRASNCCFENAVFYQSNTKDSYIDPDNGISEGQWYEDNNMNNEQEMQ